MDNYCIECWGTLLPTLTYSDPLMRDVLRDVAHLRKFFPLTGTAERRARPFRQCPGRTLLAVRGPHNLSEVVPRKPGAVQGDLGRRGEELSFSGARRLSEGEKV